jgi:hypothetical protein
MELGPLRRVAPTDQSDPDHRPHRLIPESAKPERRVRPDGSRARFLAASAAGNTTIGRDRGTGPELAAAAALKIILTANGCSVVPQPREPARPDRRRALAANRTKTGPALTPARSAPGTRAVGHAANRPPWTYPHSSGPAVGGAPMGSGSQPGGGHPFGVSSPLRTENSARFIRVVTASGPAISARIPNARHPITRFRRCNCASPWRNGQKWVDCWKCPRMGRFSVTARGSNVEPFGDALCAALISNVT